MKFDNIIKDGLIEYGYTVICSSNPMDGENNLNSTFKLIDDNYKDYII